MSAARTCNAAKRQNTFERSENISCATYRAEGISRRRSRHIALAQRAYYFVIQPAKLKSLHKKLPLSVHERGARGKSLFEICKIIGYRPDLYSCAKF